MSKSVTAANIQNIGDRVFRAGDWSPGISADGDVIVVSPSVRCGWSCSRYRRFHPGANFFGDIRDESGAGFFYLGQRGGNNLRPYRRKEAVAVPGNGLYVKGIVGVVPKRAPDLLNAFVDALFKVDECVAAPELLLNLVASYDLS